jgi:hypothetical protein
MRVSLGGAGLRPLLAMVATLGLVGAGCSLDKVEDPPLVGPSETGLSVQLTALPDVLNADGVSQAVVQLVMRDANGAAVTGRAILFCTTAPPSTIAVSECQAAPGQLVAAVGSTYVGPVQSGIVMATDQNGVANVVWVAGTEKTRIYIGVRPYGIDAATGFLRTVEIFQQ